MLKTPIVWQDLIDGYSETAMVLTAFSIGKSFFFFGLLSLASIRILSNESAALSIYQYL